MISGDFKIRVSFKWEALGEKLAKGGHENKEAY